MNYNRIRLHLFRWCFSTKSVMDVIESGLSECENKFQITIFLKITNIIQNRKQKCEEKDF